MSLESELEKRSENQCELCKSTTNLQAFFIENPKNSYSIDCYVFLCSDCNEAIQNNSHESKIWSSLNDSIWSEVPAVKVLSWRLLNRMKEEQWANDLLEMMYLSEDESLWAKSYNFTKTADKTIHLDSNGVVLQGGDSVVLIKDLNVKGGGFTAKRGTPVRNIRLVQDNPNQIEGKINGQTIVILTQFVKK
ncbi:MAG: PhnA domain-containing protein [Flavobacteriia bacterium]|nr:PhnA domain-containing protein [Flavobacteriia bacterium]